MKRFILINLAICIVTLLHAQNIENNINDAVNLLKQKNYTEAILNLQKAISLIEEEQVNKMKAILFPKIIVDFSIDNNNLEGIESKISGKRIELNQIYTKTSKAKNVTDINNEGPVDNNSTITINISNLPEKMFEIANDYIQNTNEHINTENKTILFKGYRAIQTFNSEIKQGQFSAIVGGAIIEIKAENIEDIKQLMVIANAIDLEKVIQYFGK